MVSCILVNPALSLKGLSGWPGNVYMSSFDHSLLKYHWLNFWQTENHDNHRYPSTTSLEYANVLMTAITMLPGILIILQGQEIGMRDGIADRNDVVDAWELNRSPMQWDRSLNAGTSQNSKNCTRIIIKDGITISTLLAFSWLLWPVETLHDLCQLKVKEQ